MLANLLQSSHHHIKKAKISVLVRGEDKAKTLEAKGVRSILFSSFDDHETIKQAASEHDRRTALRSEDMTK